MSISQQLGWRAFIVMIGLTVLLALLLVMTRPEAEAPLRSLPPVIVAAANVAPADIQPRYTLTGRLQPAREASLHFQVNGQVVERLVEPGQQVEQGRALLSLDQGDYADALALAEAQLAQEKAAIERDRRLLELAVQNRKLQANEVARLEKLGSESLASRSQLGEGRQRLLSLQSEEARLVYSVDTAEARLQQKQAEAERARRNLERAVLVAPFAGTVNRVEAEAGDFVTSSQMVVELVATEELDLYAEVGGTVAAALQIGQAVTVVAEGRQISGQIIALQTHPDPQTYSYALRIRLPGAGLLPGLLARVELPLLKQVQVMVAPVAAVLREEGAAYLFLIENNSLRRVAVETGTRDGERVVIRQGVEAGQMIVARDVAALSDGQVVQVSERP